MQVQDACLLAIQDVPAFCDHRDDRRRSTVTDMAGEAVEDGSGTILPPSEQIRFVEAVLNPGVLVPMALRET